MRGVETQSSAEWKVANLAMAIPREVETRASAEWAIKLAESIERTAATRSTAEWKAAHMPRVRECIRLARLAKEGHSWEDDDLQNVFDNLLSGREKYNKLMKSYNTMAEALQHGRESQRADGFANLQA